VTPKPPIGGSIGLRSDAAELPERIPMMSNDTATPDVLLQQALKALKAARHGHCDHAMADEAIAGLTAVETELAQAPPNNRAAEQLLRNELHRAAWCDKFTYPCEGESYQNWRLEVYLPVLESAKDKSPEAALNAALRHQSGLQEEQTRTPEQESVETITIQEAWEAAGGNPGIKATKEELIAALRQLDQVCDEANRPANQSDHALRRAIPVLQGRDSGDASRG
jgi:hypothetical protein